VYFSASVPKASFSLYLYLRAEAGEIDLNSYIIYEARDFHGGSGVIRHRYGAGTAFTQRELLRLNLMYSDNIATNILRRVHGISSYRAFVASIGGDPAHVLDNVFNSRLTVTDAGLFAMEIFNYTESGGRYSYEFRQHLLNNQYPFIVSDYPVASKTGWTRPIAWHDMAIVYAPSPYILVILSARYGWGARDYADFAEISMAFQEFNTTWFTN
jgi:beta-lactamase class A